MDSATRHLKWVLTSFLLVMGSVIACNYVVDSQNVYHQSADSPSGYVTALINSPYGVIWPNAERAYKLELMTTRQAECVLIGSSHIFPLRTENMPKPHCASFVNVGVGAATFEDLAILTAAAIKLPSTKRLYIEVPVWTFKWGTSLDWRQYQAGAQDATRAFGVSYSNQGQTLTSDQILNLINLKYFLANIDVLRHDRGLPHMAIPKVLTDETGSNLTETEQAMRPDGSMLFSRIYSAHHPMPVAQVENGYYRITHPYVQPLSAHNFQTMLQTVKASGIDVTLLLTPYHTKVFECSAHQVCEALAEAESTLRAMAQETGVPVLGGYDPRPFNLGPQDFLDDMHVTGAGLNRMFNR